MSTWRDALPRQTPPSSTAFCWFPFPLVPPQYLPPGSHHRLPPSSLLDLLSNSLTTAHPGPSHCVPPVSSPFPGPNSPSPPSPRFPSPPWPLSFPHSLLQVSFHANFPLTKSFSPSFPSRRPTPWTPPSLLRDRPHSPNRLPLLPGSTHNFPQLSFLLRLVLSMNVCLSFFLHRCLLIPPSTLANSTFSPQARSGLNPGTPLSPQPKGDVQRNDQLLKASLSSLTQTSNFLEEKRHLLNPVQHYCLLVFSSKESRSHSKTSLTGRRGCELERGLSG